MELMIQDLALGKTTPVGVTVKPDGTFNRRFYLPTAQRVGLDLGEIEVSPDVYLEPGNDLEVVIDYDKLMDRKAQRKRNDDAFSFGGSLGALNAEIMGAPGRQINPYTIDNALSAHEAKPLIIHKTDSLGALNEAYIASAGISPKAAQLIRTNLTSQKIQALMERAEVIDPSDKISEDYYADFLREAYSADPTILCAKETGLLLNRLAFSKILPEKRIVVDVAEYRRMLARLVEMGLEYTDEELEYINAYGGPEVTDSVQEASLMGTIFNANAITAAAERIGKGDEVRRILFIEPEYKPFSRHPETNAQLARRMAGTEQEPLLWQFAAVANSGRYVDLSELLAPEEGITDSYLIDRIMEASKPKPQTWKLPATEGGALMSQLIEPYRGKYLLVDFWDIFCGPCRQGIESNAEMRAKHRGNPGFGILFLASEKGSPLTRYEAYVAEHLKDEDVKRLPEEQMIQLRELFEFNAIPRYVLFTPEGEVLNSNYSTWEFWDFLKEKGIIGGDTDN